MHSILQAKSLAVLTRLVMSIVMLGACESDAVTRATPAATPAATRTFALSLDSTAATIGTAASSGTVRVNVGRRGGYSGVVNLTVDGAPDGVIASFSEPSLPMGATSLAASVYVERINGFAGPISLSMDMSPTGLFAYVGNPGTSASASRTVRRRSSARQRA